ncbi:MAG: 2-succinyl-5-enolpyruvyl-6-hydroxy-3-cyclohexene-1-carboxylic-acid synthase [Sphingomonadaceae bacterium]
MYSNDKRIVHLLSLMKQWGIRRVVVAPGSRHFPLVHSFEVDSDFRMYSVVDERSAAFFALGLIQKTGEPVAVTCTSGTAVINFGSAVIEAYYQGLPLVVITADRLPELLGQKEEQVFRQHDVFAGFTRYEGQLNPIQSPLGEWHCNRVINEAFLELDHHGRGPVHINIPIEAHNLDTFRTPSLPRVRKITRIEADCEPEEWETLARWLAGRRVMILWGQSNPMDEALRAALDSFLTRFDGVILADHLANCWHESAIQMSFMALKAMTRTEEKALAPDVVISLFGNQGFNDDIKRYLRGLGDTIECWDVGRSEVCDPFRRLTRIFEMRPAFFFGKLAAAATSRGGVGYRDQWLALEATVVLPKVPFGEVYAIGALMQALPVPAALHIANSLPIRISQLFALRPDIEAFCNRGVNGIDGCMSTAVGYAAEDDRLVFLVIGDLAFFYDMNALWNRHLSPRLRILVLNNEGGGLMLMAGWPEAFQAGLDRHMVAAHTATAQAWAESRGFRYLAARDRESCDAAVRTLVDPTAEGPILVEVFSDKRTDRVQYRAALQQTMKRAGKSNKVDRIERKLRQLVQRTPLMGLFRR